MERRGEPGNVNRDYPKSVWKTKHLNIIYVIKLYIVIMRCKKCQDYKKLRVDIL